MRKIKGLGMFLILIFFSLFIWTTNKSVIRAEETTNKSSSVVETEKNNLIDSTNQHTSEKKSLYSASDVVDWVSFIKALSNPDISIINITADFQVPDRPLDGLSGYLTGSNANNSGGELFVYLNARAISRKVVIQGNGHQLDFGSISLGTMDNTYNENNPWDITFSDLEVYSGNWWGFFQTVNLSVAHQNISKITFNNIDSKGNQLTASYYTNVFLSGNVSNKIIPNYTSKFRTNWRLNTDNAVNLEVRNLTIMENANVYLSSNNAGNVYAGIAGYSANVSLEKNSKLIIESNGTGPGANVNSRGASIDVNNGNLFMKENSELIINTQRPYSALNLGSSGATLSLADSSKLTINTQNNTYRTNAIARNPIYMASGSKLNVSSDAELQVNATGRGESSNSVVYVAGNATFIVQTHGLLDIKTDGTSNSEYLMNFNSSNSKFQFADAKKINLQKTTAINPTANSLINIAGTGGLLDVNIQAVSQWNSGNVTELPDYTWTPIYGLKLIYNADISSVNQVYSLTDLVTNNFKTTFTTKGVQRILFDYIPDVNVSILSTATDNVRSEDSTIIKGTTNPGAYVRLSDKPINMNDEILIDPAKNSVLSPVTGSGQDPLYTENFTIQADASGNYSYTLPEGKHFSAGTTLTAYSFLNGKTDTATQIVLDVTAPEGEPKEYHIGKGETVSDPASFVKNPKDTNPTPQKFTYRYTDKTLSEITNLVNSVGEHEIRVILMDDAKNETIITSKLIVHETTNSIDAKDINVETKNIRNMTISELETYILEQSESSAHKIVDGEYTDLKDKIQVTDLDGLSPNTTSGIYSVVFTVKAADTGLAEDLTKVIQVTVKLSEQNVRVQFVDESGKSIHDEVTLKGDVGSTIDLTKEKLVTDTITSVLSNRYLLENSGRPINETTVPIGVEESIVTYVFQGTLSIYSAPTEISFGSHEVSWKGTKENNPSYDKPLVIWDNRKNLENWKLTVKLENELSMPSSPTHVLSGVLSYQTDTEKKLLSIEAQDVLQAKHDASGQYDISTRTWGPNKQGLRLDVPSGAVKLTGEYETTLIWRVEETY